MSIRFASVLDHQVRATDRASDKSLLAPYQEMLRDKNSEHWIYISIEVPPRSFSICRDSGEVLAENQSVNVMRSLVRFDRFQIHHVAHDRVVLCDAVGAQDVARHPRRFESHPYIVALGHGNMLVAHRTSVFYAPDMQ